MAVSKHETRFILTGKDKTKAAFGGVKARLKGLSGSVSGLQGKLLALAGIGGFGLLLKGLVNTNAEFQTMMSSLKTVTGSAEAASKAFDLIEQFALTTPFELNEVVGAFIKLKSLGLDPSEAALTSYGNTASAMGKSLNQMIEAVADAATGEMERLKEFGIRARKQGDEIEFTFQGVTTTVKNNAAEITGYLQSIGNNQFGSAMADQMGNLTPAFSNLRAALQGIQVDIGEAGLNDLIAGLTNKTTEFIKSLDEQQIKDFTVAALRGFADILEAADSVVKYVSNSHLAQFGLVGYIMLGKRGIVLAGLVDYVNQKMAEDLAQNWDFLFKSGVTGRITDKNLGGYQLGDFNRSGGNQRYLGTIKEMEEKYGSMVGRQDETNSLLKEISQYVRDQSNAAVAG